MIRGDGSRSKLAQASLEFLMIVSVSLVMSMPLVLIFTNQQDNIRSDIISAQIERVATSVADTADEVYYMGPPAQKTVRIDFPQGINEIKLESNQIIFVMDVGGANYEVVREVVGTLEGNVSSGEGTKSLRFVSLQDGVRIEDA